MLVKKERQRNDKRNTCSNWK